MNKKILALGIIVLLCGGILIALSQTLDVTPAHKVQDTLEDKTYKGPNYPTNPSVLINLTANQNYTITPPTLATNPAQTLTSFSVYVDITDPYKNLTEQNLTYQQEGKTWAASPGDSGWFGNETAPFTGTYNITAYAEIPLTFARLTITSQHIEPEVTRTPYVAIFYPAVTLTIAGGVLILFGFLVNRKPRAHRPKLVKKPRAL